jgi:hypothetical protein
LAASVRRKGRGSGGARRGSRRAEQGKRKKKGRGERLTGGAQSSPVEGKRKGRAGRWAVAGKRCWASRPAGPKGKEGKFSFFSFSFSNSFQIKLFLLNSNQNPSNLFTKFYKLFRSHTSNQKPCKAK